LHPRACSDSSIASNQILEPQKQRFIASFNESAPTVQNPKYLFYAQLKPATDKETSSFWLLISQQRSLFCQQSKEVPSLMQAGFVTVLAAKASVSLRTTFPLQTHFLY
jgi:hypothetical protein